MKVEYTVKSQESAGSGISHVVVRILPVEIVNGFYPQDIQFDVKNKTFKEEIRERIKWKVKQETGLEIGNSDIHERALT